MATVYAAVETLPLSQRVFRALVNLYRAIRYHREIWMFLAVQDIQSRFRRSYFGVLWMVAHQLTFALGGGLIWSAIFNLDPSAFIPSIAAGFAIWGFIASSFVEGSNSFIMSQGYIRQVSMPVQIFILRHWAASLVNLLVGTIVALCLAILFKGPHVIFGLPALACGVVFLAFCMLTVNATMSFLGVIYGDLTHALAGIFQMLFVVSPVIYPPQVLYDRGLGWFVALNPFTSMIEIVRVPILEQTFADPFNYGIVAAVTFAFAAAYAVLDANIGRRVIFYI